MYEQLNHKQDLASYSAGLLETLLRDMAFALQKTLDKPDAANIHDLRRLCLRLRHALRVFGKLLPRKPAKKLQRRLRVLQDLLASVRSCDLGLEILKADSIGPVVRARDEKKIAAVVALERRRCLRPLRVRLRKMQRSDALRRWRTRLLASGQDPTR